MFYRVTRDPSNNILKIEYEFSGNNIFGAGGGVISQNTKLIDVNFQSNLTELLAITGK